MILAGLLGHGHQVRRVHPGRGYREEHADGTVTGGPFRYLKVAFAKLQGRRSCRASLVGVYAVAILAFGLAGGNMFQANQMFAQVENVTGGEDGPLGGAGARSSSASSSPSSSAW